MRALRLYDNDQALVAEDMDVPSPQSGCADVRLEAAFLSPYPSEFLAR